MTRLADLRLFVMVVDTGSLTAAAHALDVSPAVASAHLKRLERELDARLLLRSTRSLRPTPEGERYLAHAREALRSLDEGRQALDGTRGELRGELRISAPSDFGRHLLSAWLDRFQGLHPGLRLTLRLSDRLADIYRQPVEAALRYGPIADETLVALPLAPDNRRVLCAAPTYLARAGTPSTPADLAAHNCLCFMRGDEVHRRWPFIAPDGTRHEVAVDGDRCSDDGDAVRRWALAGFGVASKSWLDVCADMAAGRLRVLCPEWSGEPAPLYLVSPDRRLIGPTIQRLHAYLSECCAGVAPPPSGRGGLTPAAPPSPAGARRAPRGTGRRRSR